MIHESKIRNILVELDIDQSSFAVFSGLTPTRLSQAFRNVRDFTGQEVEMLSNLIEQLRGLVNDSAPIPVSFRNPRVIKALLEKRKRGLRLIPIPVGPAEVIGEIESEQVVANE